MVTLMAKEEKKIEEKNPKNAPPAAKSKEKPNQMAEKKKSIKEKMLPKKGKKVAAQQGDARQVSDAFDVIKFVLMTEKSIRMVESQNKLVFIVNRGSKKGQIKKSIETAFGSPVSDVKTVIDQSGRKKAFVKFSSAGAAGDIAIKLGII